MPHSMTAFARHEQSCEWGEVVWEIRSINHRYLEPQFRLPEGSRHLEPKLREHLKTGLTRGKVDCSLQLRLDAGRAGFLVDEALLDRLSNALDSVSARSGAEAGVAAIELLRWPGVLREQGPDADELARLVLEGFAAAVAGLLDGRQREGAELATLILQRIASIETAVSTLRAAIPALQQAQRQRLEDRLAELQLDVDGPRLEQELVYMAQRSDVEEELDRLVTHLGEVRRVLSLSGPCGRRLDFLMQELNREANTLGSKTSAAKISGTSIDVKVLIEQIREQVQNLE